MATSDRAVPWWLVLLGFLGGGFVLAALLDCDRRYVCYSCGGALKPREAPCPNCGAELDWRSLGS